MPLATLAEVFEFEKWLNQGFRDAFITQGILAEANYNLQFSPATALTPRIEFHSTPGGVIQRQAYILPDNRRRIYNTFEGKFNPAVVTNRTKQENHSQLIGQVRAAVQQISLRVGNFGAPIIGTPRVWTSEVLALTDIYLDGDSESTIDAENNLDRTVIPCALIFNVLDSAWPVNI